MAWRRMSRDFKLFLYSTLDQLILILLVSPSALLVWRGSWKLFDQFLFPEKLHLSSWVSICIGYSFIILTFIFIEMKNSTWRLFEKHLEWKMLVYPLSVSVLHAWRGLWMVMDFYIPTNGYSLLWSHIASFITLSLTKTCSNVMFMPAFFASGACSTPFQIGTRFGTFCSSVPLYYKLFDYFLTLVIVSIASITFWRSLWLAINEYLFPSHPFFSNCLSILAGYMIILTFKLVNRPFKSQVVKSPKFFAFIIQSAYCYTMGFASVNLWRGTWQLIDIYVFPENPVIVGFVSHSFGMLTLYLCGAAVNLVGTPCGTRVDSLETMSALDTMLGTIVARPKVLLEEKERLEVTEKKQLVVSTVASLHIK